MLSLIVNGLRIIFTVVVTVAWCAVFRNPDVHQISFVLILAGVTIIATAVVVAPVGDTPEKIGWRARLWLALAMSFFTALGVFKYMSAMH